MPPRSLARALRKESPLRPHVLQGTEAIARKHRALIAEDQRKRIGDSIDLDSATKQGREQEHRWDYLASVSDASRLVGIEPHSASDGEIRVVIEKKKNAVALLRSELQPGSSISHWHWVAEKVRFSRNERATRALSQSGIKFHGRMIRSLD